MPRAKNERQRPNYLVETARAEILAMCADGPVSWQQLPVGRMTEQAGWLVGEGLLHIVTINGQAHVAKKIEEKAKR